MLLRKLLGLAIHGSYCLFDNVFSIECISTCKFSLCFDPHVISQENFCKHQNIIFIFSEGVSDQFLVLVICIFDQAEILWEEMY